MSKSILAIITEIPTGGEPTHPIAPGGPPVEIWPKPGTPTHPIVIPPGVVIPPGIWGGANEPFPEHPIYIPPEGPPIVIWPSPGKPTHPIVIPPEAQPVPPGFWGGDPIPWPEHPIVIPPGNDLPTSFTVIVRNESTGEWVALSFVPGGKPPTTPGPKR